MKKIKENKGFTLVEMLACIVTLMLICMICSTGMNFALRSYQQSTFESDSQMLESTLNMYLSDILRHATDIDVNEMGEIVFTNEAYGIYNGKIATTETEENTSGNFLIYESESGAGTLILSKDAYSNTLYIENFALTYHEDSGNFVGSYMIKSTLLEDAKKECTFTCRTIAERLNKN